MERSVQEQVSPELRHKMISERAYYQAQQRGFQGGDPLRDWLEAEKEVTEWLQSRPRAATAKEQTESGLENELKQLDKKISAWSRKIRKADAMQQEEIEAHLETHRNHRHEARKKLQELSRKSGDQWEEAIFEAEQLWQKMQSFVDQISKKIR